MCVIGFRAVMPLASASRKKVDWMMERCDAMSVEQASWTLEFLRGKWTIQIFCVMLKGPVRLSQLRRAIPLASKKDLIANLRLLERKRIIVRRDLSDSVLHVEYELTGQVRAPLVELLYQCIELQNHLHRN